MRCVGGVTAVPETTDYDTIAGRYSAKIDDRPWNALYERPTTLALLPTVNNIDVLDAGCGHGWYADWLVRHGARVVAVDRSAAMVALAQVSILDPGYLNAELIEEKWGWLGEKMRYYRRPPRDLTDPLADAGFIIERMCEPTPSEELKLQDPKGYDRLCRLPAFIFVRARKG